MAAFPYSDSMADGSAIEPWMDELLDEDAMAEAPLDWNLFDSFFGTSNSTSFGSTNNQSFGSGAMSQAPVQETAATGPPPDFDTLSSNVMDLQSRYPAQTHTFNASDAFVDFSPQPTVFDDSPSQGFFNPFDTVPAEVPREEPSQEVFDQVAAAFKALARARADADPRPLSRKQKQRDASIALYLQKLRDTCDEAVAMLTPSQQQRCQKNADFDGADLSGQWWTENMVNQAVVPMAWQPSSAGTTSTDSFEHNLFSNNASPESSSLDSCANRSSSCRSPGTPVETPSAKKRRTEGPTNGGVELVLDLNMNTATSVPRKHKPRTRAQRERYLAVRNQGACEKHKKQHKRCTCIDQSGESGSWAADDAAIRSRANRPVSSPRAMQAIQQPAEINSICTAGCSPGRCSCADLAVDESLPPPREPVHQFPRRHVDQGQHRSDIVRSTIMQNASSPSFHNSSVTWDQAAVSRHSAVGLHNQPAPESVLERQAMANCHFRGAVGSSSSTHTNSGEDKSRNPQSPDVNVERAARGSPGLQSSSVSGHDRGRSYLMSPETQRQRREHLHRNGNATQDSSDVSSGPIGHDSPPGLVPNPHCTNVQRKTNADERYTPSGMGRYDISDVSSATRIPPDAAADASVYVSASSWLSLVSVCNHHVRQVSRLIYHTLQYACMACACLLTPKGWRDDWISSRRFWMTVWGVMLLFSFLMGNANPSMDSFYVNDSFFK